MRAGIKNLGAIIFVLGVAACAPTPAPVPPPPPPPVYIPPPPPPPVMPTPPGGAALSMSIPPIGIDNVRVTPNRGLTRDEQIWHFRAAMNVAALNCQGVVWGQSATEYNKMLITHKSALASVNKRVDAEFKSRYPGQNGLRVRDTKMTDLYNYFALPPVRTEFCDMSLAKLVEANTVPSAAFSEYAVGALNDVDGIYIRFYDAYVKYERDLADWNLRFAPIPQPAAVATTPTMTPGTGSTMAPGTSLVPANGPTG